MRNLKRIRRNQGYSLKDLSIKANISRSYISEIENLKKNPSLTTAKKLADALNTTIDELIK